MFLRRIFAPLACAALVAMTAPAACSGGEPCLTRDDCPIGTYCDRTGDEGFDEGTCVRDCTDSEDCPVQDPEVQSAVCNNEGRCRVTARPPRLRLLDPENDSLLSESTRNIRLVGEVETANPQAVIEIQPAARVGCASGDLQTITLPNENPGTWVTLSFVSDEVPIDPGITRLTVKASIGEIADVLEHIVEVPCPGCATLDIQTPGKISTSIGALELPLFEGTVDPPTVQQMSWRVRGEHGDVFDGGAEVVNGRFSVSRLPLFAGKNRLEVVVTGVGSGLGESRCSTFVIAGAGNERGLRGLLTWDGPTSDLDVHLIGPGGRYGDATSDLTARGGRSLFGGEVIDDFNGLGPEILLAPSMGDGVYGVIVEPVYDDQDAGANAFLRLLWNGRLLVPGPIGPAYLSSVDGDIYVAGTIEIAGGVAAWRPIGERLPAAMAPTRPPSDWPTFH